MKRLVVILAASFGFLAVFTGSAQAIELDRFVDTATTLRGYTFATEGSDAVLSIPAYAMSEAGRVTLTESEAPAEDPVGLVRVSPVVQLSIAQAVPSMLARQVYIGILPDRYSLWKKSFGYYDRRTGSWHMLNARPRGELWGAYIPFPHVAVALFEHPGVLQRNTLSAAAAAVYDVQADSYLLSHHGSDRRSIASITKLMTAMVVAEAQPDWKGVVTYTAQDQRPGATLRIRPGEKLTRRNLWYSMLLGSANNATAALARTTGLAPEEFVRRMNAIAERLGLSSTIFVEPTGLDPRNQSTAEDVARLAAAAFAHPDISKALAKRDYLFTTVGTKQRHLIRTTNELLGSAADVVGGKTGYLDEAGYCLALITEEGDEQYISVVLGTPSSRTRFAEAALLALLAAP